MNSPMNELHYHFVVSLKTWPLNQVSFSFERVPPELYFSCREWYTRYLELCLDLTVFH